MTAPRLLHFADLHLDQSTRENATHAMAQILALARGFRPNVVIDAGDLSMRRGHLAPWVSSALREWHCRLAEVAPVVVVSGNHDLSYQDGIGTVAGALDFSAAGIRIHLAEQPRVVPIWPGPVDLNARSIPKATRIACLPYPSRYMLQAVEPGLSPQEVNARAGELVERILRGLAAEAGPGSLLVFHGSITGAKTSSEIEMTTDMDVVIPEHAFPPEFKHILAGHIHRHQQIGRVVYAGSPCPLNFGEDHPHGVVLWENGAPRFHELEPKHRLVTLDWRDTPGLIHPQAALPERMDGARVRVVARIARGIDSASVIERIRPLVMERGAIEVRFQIEHAQDDRTIEIGDVRKDLGHDELLAAYAKRVPDAEPLLADLRRVFAEVDGQLAPEQRAYETYAEYKLHRIACEGYKSLAHAELVMDELGAVTVVEGENGIGKSNLAELESFAVWGRQLPRRELPKHELVLHGRQECWVEAEFSAAGERWKVRRTVRLTTKGDGKGDLILQRLPVAHFSLSDVPPEEVEALKAELKTSTFQPVILPSSYPPLSQLGWEPANQGTAAETQRMIEQMVGPHELYLSTRCASQDGIARLIDFKPAERMDAFQEALGTRAFEAREVIAKRLLGAAAEQCARVTAEIEVLEGQAGQVETLEHEREGLRCDHIGRIEARIGCEKDLEHARGALEAAKSRAAAAEACNEKRREMEARRNDLDARLLILRADAEKCVRTVSGAKAAKEQLARLDSLRGKLPALEAGEAEHRGLVEAERAARVGREAAQRDRDAAAKAVEAIVEVHGRVNRDALRIYDVEQVAREDRLERARRSAGLIEKAGFGERCVEVGCVLLSSAVQDRVSIDGLEKDIEEATRVRDEQKRARDVEQAKETGALLEAAEKARLAVEGFRTAHVSALDALGRSTFDEKALQALRQDIAAYPEQALRKADAEAQAASGRVHALIQEIGTVEAEREVVAEKLEALPPAAAVSIMGELAAEHAAKVALEAARTAETEAGKAVAALEGKLELLAGAKEKLAAKETERDAARHETAVLGVFARAMGRDGIPHLILERALPALEMHANHFLGGGDLALEIEAMRELRSGETRSEINLNFRDRFGVHPIAAASGYQRGAMGLALRAALAQVQAETHGLRVSCWTADEPMQGHDENHLLGGQQVLRRLASTFERVIYISHMPVLREVADTRVRVYANGTGGSAVEVLS